MSLCMTKFYDKLIGEFEELIMSDEKVRVAATIRLYMHEMLENCSTFVVASLFIYGYYAYTSTSKLSVFLGTLGMFIGMTPFLYFSLRKIKKGIEPDLSKTYDYEELTEQILRFYTLRAVVLVGFIPVLLFSAVMFLISSNPAVICLVADIFMIPLLLLYGRIFISLNRALKNPMQSQK